ncbi:protein phosphatase 2C 51-like [Rhododendron vialii]|uniref:protein phosphatase 2C 51-like n=1 Tax=Rhododendron vialii TaxID=182163 RepID=UPI00265DFED3|nr:protein phosphatase 2C 51-like [Rhododendron vialii]
MMNALRRRSPAPNGFRRNAFSDSGSVSHYSAKRTTSTGRKRLELRRLKSGSGGTISPDDHDPKRKRLENGSEDFGENRATEMSSSYPSSSDRSSENDVISSRDSEARDKSRSGVVTCPAHGSISLIGRRREMEDAVAVELGFLNKDSAGFDFYGVYDGHGGSCVAHACRDRLHRLLVEEMEEETTSLDWEKVMVGCFGKMDAEVNRSGRVLGAEEGSATVGSTAVVAVVGEEEVVVANCGDSRAVMSRGGVVVSMSSDHKPDRPDELERIEGAGGRVINWNGNRVLGVLATSRSIGDHYLKPFVIPKPEVKVIKRNSADEFLILATDGLWDVVSNEFACQVVKRCLEGRMKRKFQAFGNGSKFNEVVKESRAAEAAALLAELAMARGSNDNISVVVVELNHAGKCTV